MDDTICYVGVIGHRYFGGEEIDLFVQSCCYKILSDLKKEYSKIKAISAISQGADSIFAQTALSLNIKVDTVIPFDEFKTDFVDEIPYERYIKLRRNSNLETRVNFAKRSKLAYKKSMEWVVFRSSIIIAVWDGKKTGSIGGTWEAMMLCEMLNKTVVDINTNTKTMNYDFPWENN